MSSIFKEIERLKETVSSTNTCENGDKITITSEKSIKEGKKQTIELYQTLNNNNHNMTIGTKSTNGVEEFVYLSLDGKYYTKDVYNKVMNRF